MPMMGNIIHQKEVAVLLHTPPTDVNLSIINHYHSIFHTQSDYSAVPNDVLLSCE